MFLEQNLRPGWKGPHAMRVKFFLRKNLNGTPTQPDTAALKKLKVKSLNRKAERIMQNVTLPSPLLLLHQPFAFYEILEKTSGFFLVVHHQTKHPMV